MNNGLNQLKALVGITAIIGAASLGAVALFAIFAPSQLAVSAWIVAPLCLMGAALGLLASRATGSE